MCGEAGSAIRRSSRTCCGSGPFAQQSPTGTPDKRPWPARPVEAQDVRRSACGFIAAEPGSGSRDRVPFARTWASNSLKTNIRSAYRKRRRPWPRPGGRVGHSARLPDGVATARRLTSLTPQRGTTSWLHQSRRTLAATSQDGACRRSRQPTRLREPVGMRAGDNHQGGGGLAGRGRLDMMSR